MRILFFFFSFVSPALVGCSAHNAADCPSLLDMLHIIHSTVAPDERA